MANLLGMDVQEIRSLAVSMRNGGAELLSVRDRLAMSLAGSAWQGRDRDQFMQSWDSGLRVQLTEVADALLVVEGVLRRNADQQQATSDSLGGPALAGLGRVPEGGGNSAIGVVGDAWAKGAGLVQDGAAWLGDRLDDAAMWTGDRIEDGVDLAGRVWDNVTSRTAAGWAGAQRLGDGLFDMNTQAWRTIIDEGRFPRPAEVLAGVAVVAGGTFGALANVVAGEDLHFFDDGSPRVGTPFLRPPDEATKVHDFRSLTSNTMEAYESENGAVMVRVTVIRNPGEPARYLVAIPGTQGVPIDTPGAWAGSSTANDWQANLHLMANGRSTYTRAVMEAIGKAVAADRADHPWDSGPANILLTGHSQGGMVAAYLAADPQFAKQFNIQGVVNFGGPMENAGVPSSIPVLSLENGSLLRGDLIPTLDGGGRPDGLDLVLGGNVEKIRLPSRGATGDIEANHGQSGYLNNVEDVLSSSSSGSEADSGARIRMWEEVHGIGRYYLQPGGASTQIQVQVGRRVE